MPKSERDEMLSALATRIFLAMLNDMTMDATLQSHHEVARSRTVCAVCNTQCGSAHTPRSGAASLRADTPSVQPAASGSGGTATGISTPTSTKDANGHLECVNCPRLIAPTRYAHHLSQCMGMSTARRGAVRGLAKAKPTAEPGMSTSPVSDGEIESDEQPMAKGKSKSKIKRADESNFTLKRKRPASPQVTPNKKTKKQKGSPVSRVKADKEVTLPTQQSHFSPATSSQSKIPSKLRDSSTASFLERSATPSSRSASPGGFSIGTAVSSLSAQSARNSGNGRGAPRGRATGIGPPKRPSPPRPPPVHVPDYSMDVDGGNETGSSTDTDSS